MTRYFRSSHESECLFGRPGLRHSGRRYRSRNPLSLPSDFPEKRILNPSDDSDGTPGKICRISRITYLIRDISRIPCIRPIYSLNPGKMTKLPVRLKNFLSYTGVLSRVGFVLVGIGIFLALVSYAKGIQILIFVPALVLALFCYSYWEIIQIKKRIRVF